MMMGDWLEAYVALSKAYCFLCHLRTESNEREIDGIEEKIKDVQHKIYELSIGSRW